MSNGTIAAERINLLPPEIIARRRAQKKHVLYGLIGLAIIAVLGLVYSALNAQVQAEEAKLAEMEATRDRVKAAINTFNVFKEEEAELQKQEQLLTSVKGSEIRWSEILDYVSLIIPEKVQLDNFSGDSETAPPSFTISGRSSDYEGIASFTVRLRNSGRFKDVILGSMEVSSAEQGSSGDTAIKFSLTVSLIQPDAAGAAGQSAGG